MPAAIGWPWGGTFVISEACKITVIFEACRITVILKHEDLKLLSSELEIVGEVGHVTYWPTHLHHSEPAAAVATVFK